LFVLTAWSVLVAGAFWFAGVPAELAEVPFWLIPFTPAALVPSVPFAACMLAILAAHEMGHYLACRRYGVPATLPFFIPAPLLMFGTFGAVIRILRPIPHSRALFDIAAAGPLAGFAVAVPVLLYGAGTGVVIPESTPGGMLSYGNSLLTYLLLDRIYGTADIALDPVFFAGWFGLFLTTLNLFPVGQLDGGHVAYSLSRRMHKLLSWVTIGLLGGWIVYTTWTTRTPSVYNLWFLVLLFMRNRHPRLIAEGGELGSARRLVGLSLLVIFLFSFLPTPLTYIP
jgi:membrane-associated protease RseP (regulator of RpoE activity)